MQHAMRPTHLQVQQHAWMTCRKEHDDMSGVHTACTSHKVQQPSLPESDMWHQWLGLNVQQAV